MTSKSELDMVEANNQDYYEKHLGAIILKLSKFNRFNPLSS